MFEGRTAILSILDIVNFDFSLLELKNHLVKFKKPEYRGAKVDQKW